MFEVDRSLFRLTEDGVNDKGLTVMSRYLREPV
jgi:hypothetical protein